MVQDCENSVQPYSSLVIKLVLEQKNFCNTELRLLYFLSNQISRTCMQSPLRWWGKEGRNCFNFDPVADRSEIYYLSILRLYMS